LLRAHNDRAQAATPLTKPMNSRRLIR
jgi:hypothetical protein